MNQKQTGYTTTPVKIIQIKHMNILQKKNPKNENINKICAFRLKLK